MIQREIYTFVFEGGQPLGSFLKIRHPTNHKYVPNLLKFENEI